jgi:shikimate 5-dehydrogenase
MKKFGLIGHPIAHSLSPALFKAAYNGRFRYDLIEGEEFEASYQRFIDEYDGINVTAPFKEMAFSKADTRSPGCQATGAANILFKEEDGRIEASNSDITGVIGALTANTDLRQTNTEALVVGCGGAAMAAAYALCSLGYSTTIINRNIQKAKDVAERISEALSVEVSASGLEDFRKLFRRCGVIVYSLPVALDAIKTLDTKDIRGNWLGLCRHKVLLEANYKDPAFGPELIEKYTGINHKFTYIDGKEWLLHQAIDAYRIFTSEEPDLDAMRNVIREA